VEPTEATAPASARRYPMLVVTHHHPHLAMPPRSSTVSPSVAPRNPSAGAAQSGHELVVDLVMFEVERRVRESAAPDACTGAPVPFRTLLPPGRTPPAEGTWEHPREHRALPWEHHGSISSLRKQPNRQKTPWLWTQEAFVVAVSTSVRRGT
jgi:hypothetical protein